MKIRRYAVYLILLIIVIIILILIPKTEAERAGLNKRNPITITYAYCYTGTLETSLNDLIDDFNKTEGKKIGIQVEAIYFHVNYLSEVVNESILGGLSHIRLCDINTVNYETAYLAKSMDKIASLDDYLKDSVLDEYVQGYLERGRYTSDSDRGVFPLFNTTKVIYVNDVIWSDFKKAYPRYNDDVFETWEDIVEVSLDYYDWTDSLTPDIEGDGKAFVLIDPQDYFFTGSNQLSSSLIQQGHKEIRINLEKRHIRKMWDTICRGVLYGGIKLSTGANSNALLADGKIASYIESTDSVSKYPFAFKYVEEVKETDLKVFRFPAFKDSKHVSPINGEGTIVMKSNSRKEYASFYFLNWLVSQDKYVRTCYENMVIPAKSKMIADDNAKKIIGEFLESKEIGKRYRGMVLMEASSQILNYEAYAPVAFTKSTDFKNEIVKSFLKSVDEGSGEVNLLIGEGTDRKEAVKLAITEDLFDNWYKQITNIAQRY